LLVVAIRLLSMLREAAIMEDGLVVAMRELAGLADRLRARGRETATGSHRGNTNRSMASFVFAGAVSGPNMAIHSSRRLAIAGFTVRSNSEIRFGGNTAEVSGSVSSMFRTSISNRVESVRMSDRNASSTVAGWRRVKRHEIRSGESESSSSKR